jgi:hypothetical protein
MVVLSLSPLVSQDVFGSEGPLEKAEKDNPVKAIISIKVPWKKAH